MIYYQDPIMNLSESELIEQVSCRTGLSPSQVVSLIDCDLEIQHLLDYVSAVVSKRMN